MAQSQYPEIDYEEQDLAVPPPTLISTAESFEKKGNSWFVISQLPSDLAVTVDDVTFYVHKYPLLARCGYLEQNALQPSISNHGFELKLQSLPGGAEAFETVVKFCYGLPVSLSPRNAAPLRCAAEFLDMSEELEEGNLISKTESFLTFVVFSSWKDSITVLKSCQGLSPWAENLQIVRRCCDSIAWACQETTSEQSQWLNDVSTLRIDHFKRIMTSMALKGLRPEFLGSCIMMYAEKWLLARNDVEIEGAKRHTNRRKELKWCIQQGRKREQEFENEEQRMILESLVGILPHEKEAISCKFLLWMLKMGVVYSISPALIFELEKRAGMVLENASVYDLLIPNGEQGTQVKSMVDHTMYNVDSVQRILEYYLMNEEQQQTETHGKANISKLLDSYLAEIAGDPNLSATKFQAIAETLPHAARPCDDGLYRAIDIYLKAHPALSEHDRRRLCRVVDCQKLSVDACAHAAQNDRLPLRTIIQVLFAEQMKLRATMTRKQEAEDHSENSSEVQEDNWSSSKEEIKMLKVELEKMMTLIEELQRDYINLQQDCKKMKTNQKDLSGWILGWKKLKLFNGKINENENREGKEKEKEKRLSSIFRFRRRQSIS
ncbi:putative BTB/POZ domain, NPH3 domain, NPH3/RPT2-like family protein [Helianthus annuus]|nr:putative BTB/POZ domain, NPH3 domain, NPH3/RPT2-like family protein [Helianthus annuus]